MQSPDIVSKNINKIAELFPNCITETEEGKAIDFDLLKQELSDEVVEGRKERYRLEWPGKKEAIVTANLPTTKTLRPIREDSVDFDNTENIYIEGNNLEVLKILQESYFGKIKAIYIDPPYNTGNDFIYNDSFKIEIEEFKSESGQKDEFNQKLVSNPDSSGRFHSDWLSMMYSRLKLARNMLTNDGVIFISIDDNEMHNLKHICLSVFGEQNYRGTIIRSTGTRMGSGNKEISSEVDYAIIFSKSHEFQFSPLPMNEKDLRIYDQEDEKGKFLTRSLRRTGGENRREDRPSMFYPVIAPDGTEVLPLAPEGWESRWVCGKDTYENLLDNDMIVWKQMKENGADVWKVYQKHYVGEAVKYSSNNWIDIDGNKKATREVNDLFEKQKFFDHPKPVSFITRILQIANLKSNDIVLDFFSGSGTTAHAIIELNALINKKLKFIQVQLPENRELNGVAIKAGYTNICEIGKERIRRAASKIRKSTQANIDYGFRVFRVDESNMLDVYYEPHNYEQSKIDLFANNVKPDRTSEDLLIQVMLDWGLPLSLNINQVDVIGKKVFKVSGNSLFACFDNGIDEAFAREIAKDKPLRIVFKDSSFKDDTAKENVKQLLKQLSPDSEMKVI